MPRSDVCKSCRFWAQIGGNIHDDYGSCHFNPPTPTAKWAVTQAYDWCGRYAAAAIVEQAPVDERVVKFVPARDEEYPTPWHLYDGSGDSWIRRAEDADGGTILLELDATPEPEVMIDVLRALNGEQEYVAALSRCVAALNDYGSEGLEKVDAAIEKAEKLIVAYLHTNHGHLTR